MEHDGNAVYTAIFMALRVGGICFTLKQNETKTVHSHIKLDLDRVICQNIRTADRRTFILE
jgi:hypothetical protein